MLDDDHAVSAFDKGLKDGEQPLHIVAMKAGGGFVEEEEGAGRAFGVWSFEFGAGSAVACLFGGRIGAGQLRTPNSKPGAALADYTEVGNQF